MTTNTILLLLFSLLIAGGLSFYQYGYKVKNKSNLHLFLAFLRFLSIFCLLLLLINPIISTSKLEVIKTVLPIVVDNSSSVPFLGADQKARQLAKRLLTDKGIREKYEVQSFVFDADFKQTDSMSFKGSQTNLDLLAKSLKSAFRGRVFPTLLITDGNQTTGSDYVYGFAENNKVYPIVLGDTTKVLDLKIDQLNVNRYAFLKNKFPVEVFLQYNGEKAVVANLSISQGNEVVHKQKVFFSASKNSSVVNLLLPANKLGVQLYKAKLTSGVKEKNEFNNLKNFAVEVMDQKSSIAIVSSVNHPDIAALKRSIESNAQHKVSLLNPNQISSLDGFNVLILYQPNSAFRSVFEANKKANINSFIITGTATDFSFLNEQQNEIEFKMSGQAEDYLSAFDSDFNFFAVDNFGFENLPPLQHNYGSITVNTDVHILLHAKINGIATKTPLLCFSESHGKRTAFLLGENSWKWRLQTHNTYESFDKYDVFINKLIQYLGTQKARKSLIVNHENFYNSGEAIEISAQYFNKNFDFDEKAHLTIAVKNKQTKQSRNYDLLKGNGIYKVNLDGLHAGAYEFALQELKSKTIYNGHFQILNFDIEKQFVSPDVEKLRQLAARTNGEMYYPDQVDQLIKKLVDQEEYKPIQKEVVRKSPLIDWPYLLYFIAVLLSLEWFVRKYNGML